MRARIVLSIAAAVGVSCGASPPGASPPEASSAVARESSPAPTPAAVEAERDVAPREESATPPPGDGRVEVPACRVATGALTCISGACFGRPDRKPGTGPSGFLPVRVRFDASGAIAAFEPEGTEGEVAAWREVVACARGCVDRSARPRECETRIYLHTQR